MRRPLLVIGLGLLTSAILVPLISAAHSAPPVGLVRWEYIAGIVPNGAAPGGVQGYNLPWSIQEGSASVNLANGQVRFTVRGLVFGSAPVIGTTGPIDEVIGTLVCDINPADTAGFVLVDTPRVALKPQGDADFVGTVALDPVCVSEPHDLAFLIRIPSGLGVRGIGLRMERRGSPEDCCERGSFRRSVQWPLFRCGIVGKYAQGIYQTDGPSTLWLKVKNASTLR